MEKYLKVFQITFAQYFVYRLSFILWRVRNFFNLIFLYFLWTSVFHGKTVVFNYTIDKLITYIILINIMTAIVLGTRTTDVAEDIMRGNIANDLLKPLSFFKVAISRESADKIINFLFSLVEVLILLVAFHPQVFLQTNVVAYPLFILTTIIGIAISFFISLSLSFIAFWSNEIWAPRFIYMTLVSLIAGTFFPLDVLPKPIYNLLLLTPFPYLVYFPSKIFISGFSLSFVWPIFISLIWCILLYRIMLIVWDNGIKNYAAYGK